MKKMNIIIEKLWGILNFNKFAIDKMQRKISTTNWGVVIIDICIILLAVGVSVWQDNPTYLFLLLILGATGAEFSEHKEVQKR